MTKEQLIEEIKAGNITTISQIACKLAQHEAVERYTGNKEKGGNNE
jgi:hypothetical protein